MTLSEPHRRLVSLLVMAEAELGRPTMSDAWTIRSKSELRQLLEECRVAVLADGLSPAAVRALLEVFAPTCDWDDLGGSPDLGNEIFDLVETIYDDPSGAE